jgi:F-type H+-transporting ATPase subunit b
MKALRGKILQIALLALLFAGAAHARQAESKPEAAQAPAAASEAQKPASEATAQEGHPSSGDELAEASKEAEEGAQFKHSKAVKWFSKTFHIPPAAEYWILYGIDFGIIAGFVAWIMKKKMPGVFRTKNEAIRRSMDEAARVSAEARARLSEIESRLSRMDAEIAGMRASAEADAKQEEARILAAAEEDKKRIIATAEQEIAAASKLAQRELKAYASSLAVDLAEKHVKVDPDTDKALVRAFARDFGKDGQ